MYYHRPNRKYDSSQKKKTALRFSNASIILQSTRVRALNLIINWKINEVETVVEREKDTTELTRKIWNLLSSYQCINASVVVFNFEQ